MEGDNDVMMSEPQDDTSSWSAVYHRYPKIQEGRLVVVDEFYYHLCNRCSQGKSNLIYLNDGDSIQCSICENVLEPEDFLSPKIELFYLEQPDY